MFSNFSEHFSKSSVLWRISLDCRPQRRNKTAFSNFSGVVWTGHQDTRRLRVKSDKSVDKSDWLRVRNESSAHAQRIGPGQKSRFLMLTKKERGLLGRECIEIYFDLYLGEKGSIYFRSRPATSVHALQLPFTVYNFRPRSTTSVHGLQFLPSPFRFTREWVKKENDSIN